MAIDKKIGCCDQRGSCEIDRLEIRVPESVPDAGPDSATRAIAVDRAEVAQPYDVVANEGRRAHAQ